MSSSRFLATRFFATVAATALLFAACGDDTSETTTGGTTESTGVTADQTEVTADQAEADGGGMTDTDDESDESDMSGSPAEDAVVVTVAGGSVEGPGRVEVATGDTVSVMVSSDVTDEVHVHGVDETFDLAAGEPLAFEFVADIAGVFEVELENSGLLLFELAVR